MARGRRRPGLGIGPGQRQGAQHGAGSRRAGQRLDGDGALVVGLGVGDPGQLVAAHLEGDTADPPEQRLFIVDAHQRRVERALQAQRAIRAGQRVGGHFARADVAEVDRQALVGRIGVDLDPDAQRRVVLLEADRDVITHRVAVVELERAAHGRLEFVPDDGAEQLGAAAAQGALGFAVEVSEAPVAVEHEEAVGDALERCGQAIGEAEQRAVGQFALGDVMQRAAQDRLGALARVQVRARVHLAHAGVCVQAVLEIDRDAVAPGTRERGGQRRALVGVGQGHQMVESIEPRAGDARRLLGPREEAAVRTQFPTAQLKKTLRRAQPLFDALQFIGNFGQAHAAPQCDFHTIMLTHKFSTCNRFTPVTLGAFAAALHSSTCRRNTAWSPEWPAALRLL